MSLLNRTHNLKNCLIDFDSISNSIIVDENFDTLTISLKNILIDNFLKSTNENYKLFKPFFDTVDLNDKLRIIITNNLSNIIIFENLKDIEGYTYGNDYDGENGTIEIKIQKSFKKSDYTTIYFIDYLVEYINNRNNIEYIFELFSKTTNKFKILDGGNHCFYTDKFIFMDNSDFENRTNHQMKNFNQDKRDVKSTKIHENCHFANVGKIKFLPEDFYFKNNSNNKSITILFNKLSLSLLLSVFADISEFNKDTLSYKMFGYKTLENTYSFKNLNIECIEEYFNSYQEVFNSHTSISDKIGLSRNVISLHIVNNDFTKITGSICSSIRSNYNIYLKENIKKYIDVKNKITDTLFSLSNKFDNATSDLTNSLRTSFYTLATLFMSLILLKVIKGSANHFTIFTIEVFLFLSSVLIAMYFFKKYNIVDAKAESSNSKYYKIRK